MSTRTLTLTAVLTAMLCILGPVTLPLGAVPLSLTTALLMLMALLLGTKRALICCLLYLLLGLLGLPVFSGFRGGVGVLLGPTGGFLLGYIPLTYCCGVVCERTQRRSLQALAFLLGTALLYLTGAAWYAHQAGVDFSAALPVCVLPFIPGDALKILAVLTWGNAVKTRLQKGFILHHS